MSDSLQEGGAVLSDGMEVYIPKFYTGNMSFDGNIIMEAYKRYYEGQDVEKINEWLASLGITSWKIEVQEKKESDETSYFVPEVIIQDEGFLKDAASEISSNPKVEQGGYDTKAYQYGEKKPGNYSAVGSYTTVVLSNFLRKEDMGYLLDGIDAVAKYTVYGDSVPDEVKKRALALSHLPKFESESVNIGHLFSVSVEKYKISRDKRAENTEIQQPVLEQENSIPLKSASAEFKA